MPEPRWARRWEPDGRLIDAVIVVGLVVADVVSQVVVSAGGHAASPPLGGAAVVMAVVSASPLWWRRRCPLLVLLAVFVASVLSAGVAHPGLFSQHTGIPLMLAMFAVGSWSMRRKWRVAVPAVALVSIFAGLSRRSQLANAAAAALVVVALPWVAGVAARSRRSYILEVERRLAVAERERDEQARLAVLEERRHIARELHDVVAHHVSLIGVQAGAARTALQQSPETTRQALLSIEQSSRSAVGEMRQLLEVLASGDASRQLDPQPRLSGLDRLLDGFRHAGLRVSLYLSGDASTLPPVLDLCCYRVVEEALTNVARHSSAGAADVGICISPAEIRIDVRDPGPGRPSPGGPGRGLIGMRERVALFEGTLDAGRTSDGGFAVVAVISTPLVR